VGENESGREIADWRTQWKKDLLGIRIRRKREDVVGRSSFRKKMLAKKKAKLKLGRAAEKERALSKAI